MQSSKSPDFPTSLEEFGYHFNQDGELRNINTKEPFQFVVKQHDHPYNQKHYEALGDVINEEIFLLLQKRCGLKKLPIPNVSTSDKPTSFIFVSENFQSAKRLIILVHGNGVVRAGQWARRLIINNSLNCGTQIPFIEKAKELNYGIIVLNTNDNIRNGVPVKGSENPTAHASYVWKKYIQNCGTSQIFIIAHSFGGVVVTKLFQKFKESFHERVAAVALTDSVHHLENPSNYERLLQISRNWVTSEKPLDSPIQRINDIECVSAGCTQHEWTSWYSMKSIFSFFKSKTPKVV